MEITKQNFKVSVWEDNKTSNDAYSLFIKGQKMSKDIVKKKLKRKSQKLKHKKDIIKKVESNNKPILKANLKKKKSKKVSLNNTKEIKKMTVEEVKKPSQKDKKKAKISEKQEKVIAPAVFNRKTINNPILSSRRHNKDKTLRERMIERLSAARFRFLNEEIYIQDGKNAEKMFKEDPEAFNTYHNGYQQQVDKWPVNPLDVIINDVTKLSKEFVVADLGCGEAKLSKSVPQKVHSFDLVALNDDVKVCNMASTPLAVSSVDVVVFCLSLMGTNLHDYVREANRILKAGGLLKIAEVESRFDDVKTFIKGVEHFGFKKLAMNFSHNLFYFFDFKKTSKCSEGAKQSTLMLKPCLYKKR